MSERRTTEVVIRGRSNGGILEISIDEEGEQRVLEESREPMVTAGGRERSLNDGSGEARPYTKAVRL